MNQFKIFKHPSELHTIVKQGVSWPAFFFWALWALVKGFWKVAVISIGIYLLAALTAVQLGEILNILRSTSEIILLIFSLSISIFFGANGNKWIEKSLIKRGFESMAVISAENADKAFAEFLKREPDQLNKNVKFTSNTNSSIGIIVALLILIAALAAPYIYKNQNGITTESVTDSSETSNPATEIIPNTSEIIAESDADIEPISNLSLASESPSIEISRISEVPAAPTINVKIEEGSEGACESLRSTYVQGKLAESKGWLVKSVNDHREYTLVNIFSQAESAGRHDDCWIKDGMLLIFKGETPVAKLNVGENDGWKTSIGKVDNNRNGYVRLHPGVNGAPPFADLFLSNDGILVKNIPAVQKICESEVSIPNVYNMNEDEARKPLNNYGWQQDKDEIGVMNCGTNGHCYNNYLHESGTTLTLDLSGGVVDVTYKCNGETEEKTY